MALFGKVIWKPQSSVQAKGMDITADKQDSIAVNSEVVANSWYQAQLLSFPSGYSK